MIKPTKWASAQSDQNLSYLPEETLGPQLPIQHTEDSDQTGRMPIWVFTGHSLILLVLSWGGSNVWMVIIWTRLPVFKVYIAHSPFGLEEMTRLRRGDYLLSLQQSCKKLKELDARISEIRRHCLWVCQTFTWVKVWLMSHVMRKPVYAVCKQQRHRSACASAQSDQHLCCSLPEQYNTFTC